MNCIVVDDSPSVGEEARQLAETLQLPLARPDALDTHSGLALRYSNDGCLTLERLHSPEKPVAVDFERLLARRRGGRELLLRAVGGKGPRPSVVDATAGLGRDSAVLAAAGYPVTLLERHPVVAALLENGLARALHDPLIAQIAERMQLRAVTAEHWFDSIGETQRPDVVYLDPMFSASGKSALAKKEMRLFQELLGHDSDCDDLLDKALAVARYRVVVKRALKATPLAGREPSFQLKGKAVRFDVYALKSFSRDSG